MKRNSRILRIWLLSSLIGTTLLISSKGFEKHEEGKPVDAVAPRIVNIVNFIRDIEPRDPNITKDVLYQTVANQVDLMKKYHLGGTFYNTMRS